MGYGVFVLDTGGQTQQSTIRKLPLDAYVLDLLVPSVVMLVHQSIEEDVFEPLVSRVNEIRRRFFGIVSSFENDGRAPTMHELREKIRWEVQHLKELFEGIKEDKEEGSMRALRLLAWQSLSGKEDWE
ncbi:hypothetical protein D1007_33185 [Hordeum vulgare]|nr:hypothetical protein D1007_33185 [Hordeum vulgare]